MQFIGELAGRLDNFGVLVYDYAIAGLTAGCEDGIAYTRTIVHCPAELNPGMESEVRTWK